MKILNKKLILGVVLSIFVFFSFLVAFSHKQDMTQEDYGVLNTGGGNNNITHNYYKGISEAMYERLQDKYGATKSLIRNFIKTLKKENVSPADFEKKLEEIAQHYQALVQRLESFTPQDPETNKLKEAAQAALKKGEYDKAEKLLNKASDRDKAVADQLEKEMEKMQAAFTQRRLSAAAGKASNGDLQMTQLKYAGAAAYFEEAVNLVPDREEEVLIDYLNQAGTAYQDAGLYAQAQPLLEKSLTLREQLFSEDDIKIASALNNLATLYDFMGDYEQALPLYQRSLKIKEKVLGSQHPSVATTLKNLARLYELMGDYGQAFPLYNQVLEIATKILDNQQHPHSSIILANLASVCDMIGEQALPLYQKILEIRKKVLGSQHPLVTITLNDLAGLYKSMGEYEQALPLYQQALKIQEKVLGSQHPNIITTLNNLAGLYYSMKNYGQAQIVLQRSMNITKNKFKLGIDYPALQETRAYQQCVKNTLKTKLFPHLQFFK